MTNNIMYSHARDIVNFEVIDTNVMLTYIDKNKTCGFVQISPKSTTITGLLFSISGVPYKIDESGIVLVSIAPEVFVPYISDIELEYLESNTADIILNKNFNGVRMARAIEILVMEDRLYMDTKPYMQNMFSEQPLVNLQEFPETKIPYTIINPGATQHCETFTVINSNLIKYDTACGNLSETYDISIPCGKNITEFNSISSDDEIVVNDYKVDIVQDATGNNVFVGVKYHLNKKIRGCKVMSSRSELFLLSNVDRSDYNLANTINKVNKNV